MIEHVEIYHPNNLVSGKGNSTTTTLLKLKDDITSSIKSGEVTLVVFADFTKAFDTVNYPNVDKPTQSAGFFKIFYHAVIWLFIQPSAVRPGQQQNLKTALRLIRCAWPNAFNLYVTLLSHNGPSDYLQYADYTTLLRNTKPWALKRPSNHCKRKWPVWEYVLGTIIYI